MAITPEDEKKYDLRPLPDVPWIGVEESRRRQAAYETMIRANRPPTIDAGASETRTVNERDNP